MDLNSAWNLVLQLIESDWEVIILLFAAIGALKGVKVLNGGLYAQVANWIGSALASGLLDNLTFRNGLRAVVFAAGSALLYHFASKILVPQAKNLAAQLQAKK